MTDTIASDEIFAPVQPTLAERLEALEKAVKERDEQLESILGGTATTMDLMTSRFEHVDVLLEARMKEIMDLSSKVRAADQVIADLRHAASNNSSMSLMNDIWIMNQCMTKESGEWEAQLPHASMIYPFVPAHISKIPTTVISEKGEPVTIEERRISFGLSSFGYDVTLAPKCKMFTAIPANGGPYMIIDPKNFDSRCFVEQTATNGYFILPPHSFMLSVTTEYIRMPSNVTAICFNKSTYARCGINVATTVMEPGWHGQIVLEIANTTPIPAKIYANEGIAQLMFFRGERPLVDYSDRNGKYQGQTGVVEAR